MNNFIARATPWNTVQFGDAYWKLEPFERQAVLAHEMGHIVHCHAIKRILWFVSLRMFFNRAGYWNTCQAQELQADEYAMWLGCAEGLKSVLRKTPGGGLGYPTRGERIRRLENG